LRRRAAAANHLFCATNGCASLLEIEPGGATARCAICGYVRRLH
jgi:LSD1 subclass zinc finger protein